MNNYDADYEFWAPYMDAFAYATAADEAAEFARQAESARSPFATDDMIVLHEIRPGSEVAVR